MQWTDRIQQVKLWLVAAAVVIAVTSLMVSHYLVRDLQREEHNKMKTWAQAMHMLNQADESTDLSLVIAVIAENRKHTALFLGQNADAFRFVKLLFDPCQFAKHFCIPHFCDNEGGQNRSAVRLLIFSGIPRSD